MNLKESMATIISICLSSVKSANLDSLFQIFSVFLSGILVQVIKIFCILKNNFLENLAWNSVSNGEFQREKKNFFVVLFSNYPWMYNPWLFSNVAFFNLLRITNGMFAGGFALLYFFNLLKILRFSTYSQVFPILLFQI